ncbi:MAG: CHASE2 domain-containing protein, partial [Cyanobacteria bacterium P01_A01_bin.17]
EEQIDPSRIKDRIVLIGVAASSSNDDWATPYGTGRKVPGVFIQAQMTSQLLSAALDQRPSLRAWPLWGDAIWVFCWSAIGGVWAWRWSLSKPMAIAEIATLGGLTVSCAVLLIQGLWLPLIPSILACLATILSVAYARSLKYPDRKELEP